MKDKRFSKKEITFLQKELKAGFNKSKEELSTLNDLIADQKEYIKQSEMTYGSDASKIRNREMLKNMRRRAKAKVKNYKAAMKKIEKGTYGICEETGKKISKQRLMAMPEATTSIKI